MVDTGSWVRDYSLTFSHWLLVGAAVILVIVLTNRLHYRQSEAFGCPVLCHEAGLHEFDGGEAVEGFAFGDELAPGVTAVEIGVLTPEEILTRSSAVDTPEGKTSTTSLTGSSKSSVMVPRSASPTSDRLSRTVPPVRSAMV